MDGGLTGTLIDGRYRVGATVGGGGFGTVYAAVHVGLVGQVALKVPRVDHVAPVDVPALVAAFLEEGRLLKRLRHPSIVTALDVGLLPADDAGCSLPYLVLEWCEGVTLKDWLTERAGPMAREEAWALLRPAFEAIGHAHEHGIAHRDVKPSNILLEKQHASLLARVIDFGIAKVVEPEASDPAGTLRTTSDRPAYTPKYAAPEQLLGLRSGPASDVFALGLVLLEALLGRPVFASNDAARAAIADGELPTPRSLGLDLGPWAEDLERALAWRANDRFPDAHSFMRALDGEHHATFARTPPLRSLSRRPTPASSATSPVGARSTSTPAVARDEAPSATVSTSRPRAMAFAAMDLDGGKLVLALHTQAPPSEPEWRQWLELLRSQSSDIGWDLARLPNLVVTDGGAPSTGQLTRINVLMSQGHTLPATAFVTPSRLVRTLMRGFSIFNPRIRVFAPAEAAGALAHLGLDASRLPEILARYARLEADVFGAGAVAALDALKRARP